MQYCCQDFASFYHCQFIYFDFDLAIVNMQCLFGGYYDWPSD